MTENPYEAPQTIGLRIAPPIDWEAKLRRIESWQRPVIQALIAKVIGYVIVVGTRIVPAGVLSTGLLSIAVIFLFAVTLFAMWAIFGLAREMHNLVVAGFCVFAMLFPFISIVVLFFANRQADELIYRSRRGALSPTAIKLVPRKEEQG